MKYELRHVANSINKGVSVLADRLINDLGEDAIHYKGTYSECNPLAKSGNLAVAVIKSGTPNAPQKDFQVKLPRRSGIGFHGSDYNNNTSIVFNKSDLLSIANAMDDEDRFHIGIVDSISSAFAKDTERVMC